MDNQLVSPAVAIHNQVVGMIEGRAADGDPLARQGSAFGHDFLDAHGPRRLCRYGMEPRAHPYQEANRRRQHAPLRGRGMPPLQPFLCRYGNARRSANSWTPVHQSPHARALSALSSASSGRSPPKSPAWIWIFVSRFGHWMSDCKLPRDGTRVATSPYRFAFACRRGPDADHLRSVASYQPERADRTDTSTGGADIVPPVFEQ